MHYYPLCKLKIEHDFFLDGDCPDFLMEPTTKGEQILRNYRLQVKYSNAGFQILVPLVPATSKPNSQLQPFLDIPANVVIPFWLKLQNSDFYNYTKEENLFKSKNISKPVFSNENISGAGEMVIREITKNSEQLLWNTFARIDIYVKPAFLKFSQNKRSNELMVKFNTIDSYWTYYILAEGDFLITDTSESNLIFEKMDLKKQDLVKSKFELKVKNTVFENESVWLWDQLQNIENNSGTPDGNSSTIKNRLLFRSQKKIPFKAAYSHRITLNKGSESYKNLSPPPIGDQSIQVIRIK